MTTISNIDSRLLERTKVDFDYRLVAAVWGSLVLIAAYSDVLHPMDSILAALKLKTPGMQGYYPDGLGATCWIAGGWLMAKLALDRTGAIQCGILAMRMATVFCVFVFLVRVFHPH